MKLKMTMINSRNFNPLVENEYNENIFRTDERGYFMTQIYFTDSKNQSYIPAFSIEDAAGDYSLEFSADEDGTERKKFQRHSNFYYDENLGWNVAGWTYIFILENGTTIETHKLLILPDRAECEAMIKELLAIRRELFQKSSENHSGLAENLRDRNWMEILETLNEQAEEIFQLMKRVNNRRRFGLQKFQENVPASKIRRFDEKIIRQYVISPDRKKYRVPVSKISTNIFENRLLKSKLSRLKEFIERQSQQQKINAENLQQDIESQIQYIESMKEKISYRDKDLARNTLQSLKAQLQSNEKNLAVSPDKILETLNKCLNLPVFNEIDNRNEKWRMTQIFTNDANYRRAYLKLKELDEIFDFSFDADEKSFPAEKMYQIYEWWVLAKIVEFLVVKLNWRMNGSFVENLSNLFKNLEIKDKHIHLTHENSKMEMDIFYNTEIRYSLKSGNCILRPDYLFKVKSEDAEKIFILDAKYRNYEQQGDNYWINKDLRGVCLNRYIQRIKNETGKEISMSFIVHSDKTPDKCDNFLGEYVVYNGTVRFKRTFERLNGEIQQVGSFYLLPEMENAPNQSEINLSLFFKMMFEYFMKKWQICWECGSGNVEIENKETKGGSEKYHVRCKNCKAFWVKTHCRNCLNTSIIKHAVNYHLEQGGTWYVKCPKCGG